MIHPLILLLLLPTATLTLNACCCCGSDATDPLADIPGPEPSQPQDPTDAQDSAQKAPPWATPALADAPQTPWAARLFEHLEFPTHNTPIPQPQPPHIKYPTQTNPNAPNPTPNDTNTPNPNDTPTPTGFPTRSKLAQANAPKALEQPDRDLLVCRIQNPPHPIDQLHLTLGPQRPITILSPLIDGDTFFSIPLVTLHPGDTISLQLNTDPPALSGTFDKLPLQLQSPPIPLTPNPTDPLAQPPLNPTPSNPSNTAPQNTLRLTCHAMTRPLVEKALMRPALEIAEHLPTIEPALTPNPAAPLWGLTQTGLPTLRTHIQDMAALVGWADPRVQSHLQTLASLEHRWTQALTASVEKTRQSLPLPSPTALDDAQRWTPQPITCNPSTNPPVDATNPPPNTPTITCTIQIDIENTAMRPLLLLPEANKIGALGPLFALDPHGSPLPTTWHTTSPNTLDPGQHTTLTLTITAPPNVAPTLLHIQSPTNNHLLRIK